SGEARQSNERNEPDQSNEPDLSKEPDQLSQPNQASQPGQPNQPRPSGTPDGAALWASLTRSLTRLRQSAQMGIGGYLPEPRASLMLALAHVAALSGRVADPLTSLLLAVVAMAALDPAILLNVGLQLSLSATLGIVLLWPAFRRRLRRLPRVLSEPLGLTLAVTLACLPVSLSAFQLVSLVSPLAHVLAVPLLPLVLVSAGALAMVSPWPALATPAAWLA